ncbi:hypothetical protein CEXT_736241, partial [Caerostris extrusa]
QSLSSAVSAKPTITGITDASGMKHQAVVHQVQLNRTNKHCRSRLLVEDHKGTGTNATQHFRLWLLVVDRRSATNATPGSMTSGVTSETGTTGIPGSPPSDETTGSARLSSVSQKPSVGVTTGIMARADPAASSVQCNNHTCRKHSFNLIYLMNDQHLEKNLQDLQQKEKQVLQ